MSIEESIVRPSARAAPIAILPAKCLGSDYVLNTIELSLKSLNTKLH